ncbi:putative RNA-binding protein [Ceratocystis platani]|uniref:Putative RNA-binding protein n=1 Tax=Ceratocystis fimbriata f. sp. platani TaxID=88771 RepID=A0A0F8BNZ6_CERFI|nr:putative RNA-binding protein [Ceratocystis platani]
MAVKRRREDDEEVAAATSAAYDLENPVGTKPKKSSKKDKPFQSKAVKAKLKAKNDEDAENAEDPEVATAGDKDDGATVLEKPADETKQQLSKKQLKKLEKKVKKAKEISEKDAVKTTEREKKKAEIAQDTQAEEEARIDDATEDIIKVDGDTGGENAEDTDENQDEEHDKKKKERFIVFVGNLPFTAKEEHLRKHFASLEPSSIRLLTSKSDPTKTRGIAFIEFSHWRSMRTCLDKFHHSTFDDGLSPARKINIELTAGGGGKTAHRTAKIKAKNDKLRASRSRRIQRESDERSQRKEKEDIEAAETARETGMHPARLAQIKEGGAPETNSNNSGNGGRFGGRGRGGFGGGRGRGGFGRGGGGRGGGRGGDRDGRDFKRQRR